MGAWLRRIRHPIAAFSQRLEELSVDDTELEDELEPLYQHGIKMDNGLGLGMNGLGAFPPKLHDYE
jgi:hypothetical protein